METFYSSYYKGLEMPGHFVSREVQAGSVTIGGKQPVRIQSMTNTNTFDTVSTVAQTIALIKAGCELVRITAPTVKAARNLYNIKNELRLKGYQTPLIADIHFQPKAAETAAEIVEKVRINPGNYADKKKKPGAYSDTAYDLELIRIAERFQPLLKVCQFNGTAIRIGVNQGSLSNRIMSRYGDTPAGMVESALEFARICEDFSFHNFVISMKSSNVRLMIQATRLLIARMTATKMNYPVHLGVTEAGDGEDGRIKSAIGIGTLLEEGIGDTIRVSLTEDPVNEIPFAKKLISFYTDSNGLRTLPPAMPPLKNPFTYQKRDTLKVGDIGGDRHPVVVASTHGNEADISLKPDYIFDKKVLRAVTASFHTRIYWVKDIFQGDLADGERPIVIEPGSDAPVSDFRNAIDFLNHHNIMLPVILKSHYSFSDPVDFLIRASIDLGSLLVDGDCDGIWLGASDSMSPEYALQMAFGILQASGARITRTEFIACPSCGRTKFNILEALQKVKAATNHLKGLKIAVMGCIVNGPGEMADADYGYVGEGRGKVTIYKSSIPVSKNIPENEAVETLVALIKEHMDWVDPP